jgi:uncharacterized membrane protein
MFVDGPSNQLNDSPPLSAATSTAAVLRVGQKHHHPQLSRLSHRMNPQPFSTGVLSVWRTRVRGMLVRVIRIHATTLVVLVAALSYIVTMGQLALLKYDTFHSTFTSLGITSHQIWLVSHGGMGLYYSTGFQSVAYPYGKPLLFLLVPIYWVYPHLSLLVLLQTVVLGGAAIPLYFYARIRIRSESLAMIVALAWLAYYAVSNANLADELTLCWFPMLFFVSCYFYEHQNRLATYLFAFLAGLVNALTALVMFLFVLLHRVRVNNHGVNAPPEQSIARHFRNLLGDRLWVGAMACFVVTWIPIVVGSYLTGNVTNISGASGASSAIDILLTDINVKLLFFTLLFAPVAFLPLLDLKADILLLPIVGFIFYSVNSGTYVAFGHPYTALVAAPVFMGLVRVLGRLRSMDFENRQNASVSSRLMFSKARPHLQVRLGLADRAILLVALTSVIFGAVYFPLSPLNSHVSGGLFSGNQQAADFEVTPATSFLWTLIDMVPPSASVLTQNNIPQLSDRAFYQVPEIPNLGFTPDYVLVDTDLVYFSSPQSDFGFINDSLSASTYGIVGEGYGALLIEHGYTGRTKAWVPYQGYYDGSSLSIYDGRLEGARIVNDEAAYAMWYGPGISLYPGSYSVDYTLQSNRTGSNSTNLITLEAVSLGGAVVLNQTVLTLASFAAPNVPMVFQLNFSLSEITQGVGFRGISTTGAAQLTLDNVTLQQTRVS